ncbi:MAG: MiaB/RimO family radical SAM methylthiotransferase [Pseudomonadota bacterium]
MTADLLKEPAERADATETTGSASDGPSLRGVFIKTYGCQMNVYDSERMVSILKPLGYGPIEDPANADLIILNTCHIREKAAEKVYSELGRLRQIKETRQSAGHETKIAVAGCVAQAEGAEIKARAPVVDMVFGPQSFHRLPEMLARLSREEGHVLETDFAVEEKFDRLDQGPRDVDGPTAFLTIQEGCDKFCTFCVVPYTRGAEVSRSVDEIVAEARGLAAQGVREITLLGQNVNGWHGKNPWHRPNTLQGIGPNGGVAFDDNLTDSPTDWSLGHLCRHLAKIDGLDRIRFTTSHPRDMDDDLIDALGHERKLMPYLHLPVQAGSDKILKAMNRGHTAEDYVRLIEKVRAARPDIALSGDFIVGFPGEREEDFQATLDLVREVTYASAFSFKYSRRPGTPGSTMTQQVGEEEKDDRLERLQALLNDQRAAFNASLVGKTLPVLIEKKGRNPGQIIGRSPYLQSVFMDGDESLIGTIVHAEIGGQTPNALSGVITDQPANRT